MRRELKNEMPSGRPGHCSSPQLAHALWVLLLDGGLISNGQEAVQSTQAVGGRDTGVFRQCSFEKITYSLLLRATLQEVDDPVEPLTALMDGGHSYIEVHLVKLGHH